MNRAVVGWLVGAIVCAAVAIAVERGPSAAIEIQTEDVARFYKVYDAAGGRPTAEQLQRDYIDPGTDGLRHLLKVRPVTAERIAQAIAAHPELYTNARSCMAVLPRVRERLNFDLPKPNHALSRGREAAGDDPHRPRQAAGDRRPRTRCPDRS